MTDRLKCLARSIFRGGVGDDFSEEQVREVVLINTTFLIGIAFLVPFGVVAYLQKHVFLGLFDHVTAGMLFACLLFLRWTHKLPFTKAISIGMMSGLFFYLMMEPGAGGTGPLWTFTFPLFVLFFIGIKRGSVVTAVFWVATVFLFVFDLPRPQYGIDFKLRYSAAFLAIFAIAFFFEHVRNKTHARIQQNNLDLQSTVEEVRKTERALRESENKYRNLIQKVSVGILIVEDTIVRMANPSFLQMCGYSREEFEDTVFDRYLPRDQRDKILDAGRHRQRSGETVLEVYETVIRHRDGHPVDVEITASYIRSGDKIADILFIRDISGQKATQKEKEKLEEQLRQSQKMEAIGRLAGGLAHDFNNMLGGVTGFADVIRQEFAHLDPRLEKYTQGILASAERAADLTMKLLAFARKGKFQMIEVDLHETILNAVRILEHTLDKRIAIRTEFQAEQATVMGDPTQLQNVILNLAVNAGDAMPGGGDLIIASKVMHIGSQHVRTRSYKMKAGPYLVISVRDNGKGMDETTKSRLFEPFFTTKPPGEGTGLGLASVYGTIKNHLGYIDVESEPGRGTVFEIYLNPVDRPGEFAVEAKDETKRGQGRILVIDDEAIIREVAMEMLVNLGYTVHICKDGHEGVAFFKEHRDQTDLVITDITMPGMNGHECLLELKKIDPDVRVIATSGYSIDGEARKLIDAGAVGFIQKPFDLQQLSLTIYEALCSGAGPVRNAGRAACHPKHQK